MSLKLCSKIEPKILPEDNSKVVIDPSLDQSHRKVPSRFHSSEPKIVNSKKIKAELPKEALRTEQCINPFVFTGCPQFQCLPMMYCPIPIPQYQINLPYTYPIYPYQQNGFNSRCGGKSERKLNGGIILALFSFSFFNLYA